MAAAQEHWHLFPPVSGGLRGGRDGAAADDSDACYGLDKAIQSVDVASTETLDELTVLLKCLGVVRLLVGVRESVHATTSLRRSSPSSSARWLVWT